MIPSETKTNNKPTSQLVWSKFTLKTGTNIIEHWISAEKTESTLEMTDFNLTEYYNTWGHEIRAVDVLLSFTLQYTGIPHLPIA